LLAEQLGREFADTDEIIANRAGRPIAAIFAEEGEARFRQMEADLATELAGRRGLVIATGGRLMLDPVNATALGATGPVFCLTASPAQIVDRIGAEIDLRPLLGDEPTGRVQALLAQRETAYARFREVPTGGKTPDEVAGAIAAMLAGGLRETIPVRYPGGSYEVIVGEGLLSGALKMAGIPGQRVIVTDSNVGPLHAAGLSSSIPVVTIPAGEQYKRLDTVRDIYDTLLAQGVGRDGAIFALGGGVVGDVAGFAAATYLRGIDVIFCPTTLLAMVDASIGGKTGVDLPQGKNLVGAFKQPRLVLADITTLATLPAAEFTAGLAEVAKHGLIADPLLWRRLEAEQWRIEPGRLTAERLLREGLHTLVARAIRVKRDVVEEDPYETGRRAVLNLGHTFGHAIEQLSGYTIPHGFAVAMGIAAAARLSAALGECNPALPREIESVLSGLGLPVRIPPPLAPGLLYAAMGSDKKKQAGRLRFVLIRDIGDVFVRDGVPKTVVLSVLAELVAQ
jgi:3-dehydroquinate synthase